MAIAKTTTAIDNTTDFGLSTTSVRIDPAAPLDQLLFDTLCLLRNALAVFDRMADDGEVPELHFAGLYLLRQGVCALTAATDAQPRPAA